MSAFVGSLCISYSCLILNFLLLTALPGFAQEALRTENSRRPAVAAGGKSGGEAAGAGLPAAVAPGEDPSLSSFGRGSALPARLESTVEVNANQEMLESGVSAPYHITQDEVLSSAGTFGDFTRYLQLLPGVVGNSDLSNGMMVRGGNPSENLFVVNGIEVPGINHFALEGTTGGFTSMLDTATVAGVDMKPGVYDARYANRLSSLVDIHTLGGGPAERGGGLDAGISGAGGFLLRPLGKTGSVLFAGHRSILNLITNDIGMNGVPIYTNWLGQAEWSPGEKDHLSLLSLSGNDEIDIAPYSCDPGLTVPDSTRYHGSRSTSGLGWQHVFGPAMVSTFTASYSYQGQDIVQQRLAKYCEEASPMVYDEHTVDSTPSLQYDLQLGRRDWLYSFGAVGRLPQVNYSVQQPMGEQSPFSETSAWKDATSFQRNLTTGQTAGYAEVVGHIGSRWTLMAGAREETFALTGSHTFAPRASLAFRIGQHQAVNVSYGQSAQLAPTIELLSFPQNARLRPIRVEQAEAGAELWRGRFLAVNLDAYRKLYSDEPESTEYASLMLANMVDTLGQQFVHLPLKSGGRGQSSGVELLLQSRWGDRVQMLGSASYATTLYAAADGVLRPGNFDLPFVGNGVVSLRLPWGLQGSFRDTYESGRPYTPFNIALSEQQSRGIYDLNRVNGLRGPAYNRLDFHFSRGIQFGRHTLTFHGGMQNALGRDNFLGYAWEDNCLSPAQNNCGINPDAIPGVPETRLNQMPRFPSAGVRYSF